MTRWLASLPLAVVLLAGCRGRSTPSDSTSGPGAMARPIVAESAAPSASSSAPTAPGAPERWTDQSMVAELKARLESQRGEFVLAVSLASELGDEGELYLERHPDGVRGRWDSTIVSGTLDASGALTLRDAASDAVILEGTGAPDHLVGALRGEGEVRAVRALPPRDLTTLDEKLDVRESSRALTLPFVHGQPGSNRARIVMNPPISLRQPSRPTTARLVDGAVELTDERGTWRLHPTARGLLGRSPDGVLATASFGQPDPSQRLPWKGPGVAITSSRFGRGHYPETKCEISVDQPTVTGTPHDDVLTARLRQMALDAAAPPWGSASEPAKKTDYECRIDADMPVQIQSAWYTAWPLRDGFVGLELTSYGRFSDMSATAGARCLLLDGRAGRLIEDIAKELPESTRQAIATQANRVLRRRVRSVKLTDNNSDHLVDSLESLDAMQTCLTATGVEIRVPSGTLTRSPPSIAVAGWIPVPGALVAPAVAADHPLARLINP